MACPYCGAEVRPGQKFCFDCGTRLGANCANCGAPLIDNARFCGECGTPVDVASGERSAAPPTPAVGGTPPAGTPSAGRGAGAAPAASGPAAAVAERRLVSVLFADLVGFTTYSESRDAEEVRELLSSYFELAREVIGRYGGTIEKFIGDAVMAVWGAPVAFEDDAERAVRAGIDLVDAVKGLGRSREIPELALRAGVLTGEAAVTIGAEGQGMVAGDLVNTASRLQSVAPSETVLVGEATYRASKDAIAFEPAGEQTLKGKVAPVPAWRALRVTAKRGGVGRREEIEAPFVGRDEELRILKDLLHLTTREGRARLVSVIGLAGLGKSRLAWEFNKYIDGLVEDLYWHQGRSLAYGEGVTFWALGEMVRRRAGIAETDDSQTTAEKLAATLADYVPDLAERRWIEPRLAHLLGLQDAPSGEREELFAAWRTFFERVSQRGPTILVFEDCQWADGGVLDFIEYMLEWSRNHPIFIVTLARPDLLDRRPGWGSGQRSFTGIRLEPLRDEAMRSLLAGLAPGLPDGVVAQILERAEGVPLYAVETVRMLADQGILEAGDDAYRVVGTLQPGRLGQLAIPETLHALISARLDSLDAADRGLLQDASILGQTFTIDSLAAATSRTADEIEPQLRALVHREVLVLDADPRSPERGQYGFGQAILREVAYATLSKADRRAKHLAAARYWESFGDPELAAVLASHYVDAYRASPAGPEADALAAQARVALRAAAERAIALHSYDQALAYLEQGLSVTTEPADRAALWRSAALAARASARFDVAERYLRQLIDWARETGDRTALADAAAKLTATLAFTSQNQAAIELDAVILAELGDVAREPAGIELLAELGRAYYLTGDSVRAVESIDEALRSAERENLVPVITEALITKGTMLASGEQPRQGVALLRGAQALAESHGLVGAQLRAINNISYLLFFDDPRASLAMARGGIDLARRFGITEWLGLYGSATAAAFIGGEWSTGLQLTSELDSDTTDQQVRAETNLNTAMILVLQGAFDEADRRSSVGERFATESHDPQMSALFEIYRAYLGLASDRLEDAHARALAARSTTWVAPMPAWGAEIAARAALWMRDLERAQQASADLQATFTFGTAIDTARMTIAAGVAALRGDRNEAIAGYTEAANRWRSVGSTFGLALNQLDWALLFGPDHPAANAAAEEARDLLQTLGAKPLLERLDAATRGPGAKTAHAAKPRPEPQAVEAT